MSRESPCRDRSIPARIQELPPAAGRDRHVMRYPRTSGLTCDEPGRGVADAMMRLCLREAGLDFDRPAPMLAWAAFPRFAVRPLPGSATVTVGYFSEHFSD